LIDLEFETNTGGPVFVNPHQDVAFSPLLVVTLKLAKEKAFKKSAASLKVLISKATLGLFYHQSSPEYLIQLIKSSLDCYPKEFSDFAKVNIIFSWF
jgi:hypothetical protein